MQTLSRNSRRLKHARSEVKKKQAELKSSEKDYNKDKVVFDSARRDVEKMTTEIKRLNYEEGRQEVLSEQRRRLAGEVQALREKVDTLEARFTAHVLGFYLISVLYMYLGFCSAGHF